MNSINEISNDRCVGCSGCIIACPFDAIDINLDVDGFIVATANNKCVDCGKCKKVCYKFLDGKEESFPHVKNVYVGNNIDINVRYPSSSGGIVSALAKGALNQGYVVAGAYLDMKVKKLKHILIDKEEQLPLIIGSKYIPSFTENVFRKIADCGKVLYIGTPCQVYTLRKLYPKKDILYIDFRCAGTAGYMLFNKYNSYLSSVNSSGIEKINFRAKNRSWHIWGIETTFCDGTKFFKDKYHDLFGKCFSVYADCVHDVCRSCQFINDSMADIRVEDAWHQMHHVKKNDYKNGFSQIAVFTERGAELLEWADQSLYLKEVEDDFHNHTKRKKRLQSTLYYRIREDNIPLEETIAEFERRLPLSKRLISYLAYLASINLYLYRMIRYVYKKFR